jgi:hypothetical protein
MQSLPRGPKPSATSCTCRACNQRFADVEAFDSHRPQLPAGGISVARYLELVASGQRDCLDPRQNLRLNRAGLWEAPRRARVSGAARMETDAIAVETRERLRAAS